MRNFCLLMVIMMLFVACQKESEIYDQEDNVNVQPIFKEYSAVSIESVLRFMDEEFYEAHVDHISSQALQVKGHLFFIGEASDGTKYWRCMAPLNEECIVTCTSTGSTYAPCSGLINDYNYDTTSADRDFMVLCTDPLPTLYQGEIDYSYVGDTGYIDSMYFNWNGGYITVLNEYITIEND